MFKLLILFSFLIISSLSYTQDKWNPKIDLPEWTQAMIGYYDIYKNKLLSDSILVNEQQTDSLGHSILIYRYKPRIEPSFDGYIEWLKDISTYYEYGNKK